MSLANPKASPFYKEAVTATSNGWEDQGVGFTEKGSASLAILTRQLNTLIYSVIKIKDDIEGLKEEVTQIHQRVKSIEKRSGQSSGAPDYKADLDEITKKLSSLTIQGDKIKEVGGNLKVFKNPYEILRSLQ
nr:ORFII protein [Banana streak MY virus]QVG60624.1 ORFII protein [Banana streak MY virus]